MEKTSGSEGRRWLLPALVASMLLAAPAYAQDDRTKNAARELAEQAAKASEQGDYVTAQDLYGRAYALVPAPTLSLRRARALVKLGRLVEAVEAYVRTTRTRLDAKSTVAFRDAVDQANSELVSLRPRVPKLTVMLENGDSKQAGLKIQLDDKPYSAALVGVSSPVDPGKHHLEVVTSDNRQASANVTLAEAETKTVTLRLPAAEPGAVAAGPEDDTPATSPDVVPVHDQQPGAKARSSQRTWALVGFGVGAAGIGVGVVSGVLAAGRHSDAEKACPNGRCVAGSAGADDVDSFHRLRTISTVGYIVGVVGVGAGVTLWLTAPKTREQASVGAFVGPARAGVVGVF